MISCALLAVFWDWMKKHWKDLLIGLIVILCAAFISSWMMRGAKIERQKIEYETLEMELDVCEGFNEGLAETIVKIEKTHTDAIQAAELRDIRLNEELVRVNEEADRQRRRAEQVDLSPIEDAETPDEEIEAFLDIVSEWRP